MKIKDLMLFMTILVLQVQKLVGPAKLRAVFAMKMRNVSQEEVANNPKLHSKMKNQISTRTSNIKENSTLLVKQKADYHYFFHTPFSQPSLRQPVN